MAEPFTVSAFAELHGLTFADPSLLVQALTHRSYLNEVTDPDTPDNERLEFLGDAVLGFISADWLFQRLPDAPEGKMTRLRAALVRKETLAGFARDLRIGEALRMGKGESLGGGRSRTTILCAAFEAVVGAVYLDQGMAAARAFVEPRFEDGLRDIVAVGGDRDARSELQELAQARYSLTPDYQIVSVTGPDHQREFVVVVTVGALVRAEGTGHSKQAASMNAAQQALTRLTAAEP